MDTESKILITRILRDSEGRRPNDARRSKEFKKAVVELAKQIGAANASAQIGLERYFVDQWVSMSDANPAIFTKGSAKLSLESSDAQCASRSLKQDPSRGRGLQVLRVHEVESAPQLATRSPDSTIAITDAYGRSMRIPVSSSLALTALDRFFGGPV